MGAIGELTSNERAARNAYDAATLAEVKMMLATLPPSRAGQDALWRIRERDGAWEAARAGAKS